MFKRHSLCALISLFIIALNSCVHEPVSQPQVILVNFKAKEVYQYDFGYWDSDALAVITQKAKHAKISNVEVIPNFEKAIYTYSPTCGFKGEDQVEIEVYHIDDETINRDPVFKIHLKIMVEE